MVGLPFWSPDPIPGMSMATMGYRTTVGRSTIRTSDVWITRTLGLTEADCTCLSHRSFGAHPNRVP